MAISGGSVSHLFIETVYSTVSVISKHESSDVIIVSVSVMFQPMSGEI